MLLDAQANCPWFLAGQVQKRRLRSSVLKGKGPTTQKRSLKNFLVVKKKKVRFSSNSAAKPVRDVAVHRRSWQQQPRVMLKPGPESLSHGPLIITQPWSPSSLAASGITLDAFPTMPPVSGYLITYGILLLVVQRVAEKKKKKRVQSPGFSRLLEEALAWRGK